MLYLVGESVKQEGSQLGSRPVSQALSQEGKLSTRQPTSPLVRQSSREAASKSVSQLMLFFIVGVGAIARRKRSRPNPRSKNPARILPATHIYIDISATSSIARHSFKVTIYGHICRDLKWVKKKKKGYNVLKVECYIKS